MVVPFPSRSPKQTPHFGLTGRERPLAGALRCCRSLIGISQRRSRRLALHPAIGLSHPRFWVRQALELPNNLELPADAYRIQLRLEGLQAGAALTAYPPVAALFEVLSLAVDKPAVGEHLPELQAERDAAECG
jgi:hypothetical protein